MVDYNMSMAPVNPLGGFLQGWQIGEALKQQRAAQERQAAQQRMAQRMQQALGSLRPDSGPMEFAALVDQFPDLAEPLTKQYGTFDTARKTALFDAGQRAFSLLQPGAEGMGGADAAAADLEQSAIAFENSNQPAVAKQLRDAAKGVKMNPGAARQTLGMMLAFADPDKFKKIGDAVGQKDLTGFQKDLAASGIDPESDEGKRLARQYVQNRVDPIVTMETPTGAQFIGPMSEYQRRYGGGGAPRKLPVVSSKEQFDALPSGTEFVAPDGSVRRKP